MMMMRIVIIADFARMDMKPIPKVVRSIRVDPNLGKMEENQQHICCIVHVLLALFSLL
jgi:hypothetical protein